MLLLIPFLFHLREKVTRVILMLADEQREMQQICEGNIAVVVGMKHVSLINYSMAPKIMCFFNHNLYFL